MRARASAAGLDTKSAAAAALKADIIKHAGSKYGHDLDAATRETVQAKVKQLEDLQLPVKVEQDALTGTKWTTVFTTSDGECSRQDKNAEVALAGFGGDRGRTNNQAVRSKHQ